MPDLNDSHQRYRWTGLPPMRHNAAWPFPAERDDPTARARRIAVVLLQVVAEFEPEWAEQVRTSAAEKGEPWLGTPSGAEILPFPRRR